MPATYHPRLELVEVQKALKHMVKPGADGEQATPVVGFPPEFTTESGEVRPPRARLRARARARSPACPPACPPARLELHGVACRVVSWWRQVHLPFKWFWATFSAMD